MAKEGMELTFVHQYSGDAPKRRRLAHACATCRARKKRCKHYAGAEKGEENNTQADVAAENADADQTIDSPGLNGTPSAQHSNSSHAGVNGVGSTVISRKHSRPMSASSKARFISDLNPESTLLNRPAPSTDSSRKLLNDDIGVWIDRSEYDALVKQKHDAANQIVVLNGVHSTQRPHSAVLGPLIDIYFKKIHPILPLLDEDEFRQQHAGGIIPEPLVHAMCLVAAKDSEAEPHLKLSDATTTVTPRHFCSILHDSVTASLRVPVRFEKIMLIRILALTSLHTEGPEGAEEASILLSQAMHYGQTLGIHLGQQAASPAGNELVMKRLFWSLWILDRTNSAVNGRPIVMSDADIAIEPFAPGESGFPAFEAWLKIAILLNKIIDFYRPTNDMSMTGWEGDWPSLEGIIDEVEGWHLPATTLGTIHLFYLTVGVLSHRTRGAKEMPCGLTSHLRQRLYAIEIVRLMNAPKSPTLHPLPVLPYAVSLALSVSYQHVRQAQLEHQQAGARNDLRTCCRILQNLRRTWASADVMATLAKKVLDELDRAPDLAVFRIPRAHKNDTQALENDIIPPPTVCNHGKDNVGNLPAGNGNVDPTALTAPVAGAGTAAAAGLELASDGINLFDNMDDLFGTFMDPNYPLNLDDMSWMDDLTPFDWTAEIPGS